MALLLDVAQPFVPIGEATRLRDGALLANNGVMYLCSVCPGKKLWLKKHVEDHVVSKVVSEHWLWIVSVGHCAKKNTILCPLPPPNVAFSPRTP
jgi:5-methylcytosine-specific restriction endonuclease McrA